MARPAFNLELAFLGTGTCDGTPRNPFSMALSNGREVVFIDAGGGCYHQLARLESDFFRYDAIDAVILTHFHVDHVSGLPDMLWGEMNCSRGKRHRPFTIAGASGAGEFVETRLIPMIGKHEIPFQLVPLELEYGREREISFLRVMPFALAHTESSAGYLISACGKRIAVTGDTGYCPNLVSLLKQSDVAVIEWSFADFRQNQKHLSSADIVRLLKEDAFPKLVYVCHRYLSEDRSFVEQEMRLRDILGTCADRFVFPDDREIVALE